MERDKESIYIKSLLAEVGLTLTGEDALNIISAKDTHTVLEYYKNGHVIQYILTLEWATFEKQFMTILNIKDNDTFLTNNIILSYAPNRFLAEKTYNAWLKEIKTNFPTKFFCQRDCQFYEIPGLD